MKKIVRLTESDLTKLVNRVINEQTKLKKFDCFGYFYSKGIDFVQDGGNYSSWYPNVPGYYVEGNLTHDDYEPSVYFYKEDKLNKLIPMNPKLVTTIKSLASTMGGEFGVDGKGMYRVDFQPGRCKNFGEFGLKLINLLKQFK
jgi:hypothetical protein